MTLLIGLRYNEKEGIARFEFPVLVMLATTMTVVLVKVLDVLASALG